MKPVFTGFYFLMMVCFANAQSWKEITRFSPQQTIQKIRFLTSELGYCVSSLYNGSTMNIHKTTNGGLSWTDQSSGYSATRFMDIFILNEQTAFMSGNDGLIIKTTDGGNKWETKTTGTKEQLWGLHFLDDQTGFACGAYGMILKTEDGGESWFSIPTGLNNLLYSICFVDDKKGFASGSNVLLRTDDGGDSWTAVKDFPFTPPADWIRRIKFVNTQVGYACADIGRIYKTVDGGTKWTSLNSGVQEPLMDLDFADALTGVVVGFNGTILKTTDGGQSWTQMPCPLGPEHLFSVDLVNQNSGFICTYLGRILRNDELLSTVNIEDREFQLWQNQSTGIIEIRSNKQFDEKSIVFFSADGKKVNAELIGKTELAVQYRVQGFPTGLYFARLTIDKKSNSLSFVVSQQ